MEATCHRCNSTVWRYERILLHIVSSGVVSEPHGETSAIYCAGCGKKANTVNEGRVRDMVQAAKA